MPLQKKIDGRQHFVLRGKLAQKSSDPSISDIRKNFREWSGDGQSERLD